MKKNFRSQDYCSICLIKKKHKTHHVKKMNLCVKGYHFYDHVFDKLVFNLNQKHFLITVVVQVLICVVDLKFLGKCEQQ